MAGEVAALAAEGTPYAIAALGAYGAAVLATARDELADATIVTGRRLLQRIFGYKKDGEPLPPALAKVLANPDDQDYLGALRATIRDALEHDAQMLAEIREIIGAARPVVNAAQNVTAGRDAYVAGRDMTITGPRE